MKIAFDVSLMSSIHAMIDSRGGCFFCALELFKEFRKRHELLLFADYSKCKYIRKYEIFDPYVIVPPRTLVEKLASEVFVLREKLTPHRHFFPVHICCKALSLYLILFEKLHKDDFSRKEFADVDCFFSPYDCRISKANKPAFTLLHDVIPLLPFNFSPKNNVSAFKKKIVENLSPDSYYFTNSDFTRRDFLKYCPHKLDPEKIRVTYLGVDSHFGFDDDDKKYDLICQKYGIPKDQKYLFSLCSINPRKNLDFVIEQFLNFLEREKIDDLILVLSGVGRLEMAEKMRSRKALYDKKVFHVGYVDDSDLSVLFSHSLCSVSLSLYEGFGLPVLESMKCGCPVIASCTTSIPEVCGDCGIQVDPKDAEGVQKAMSRIYHEPELRMELRRKGLERAKLFSWKKCADQMLEYMEEVVEKTKAAGEPI